MIEIQLLNCEACDDPEMSYMEIEDNAGQSHFVYVSCGRCGFRGPYFEKTGYTEQEQDFAAAQNWNEIQAQLKAGRQIEKARAVLAEHQKLVTLAQAGAAKGLVTDKAMLLVAELADALGGGHE